MSRTKSYCGLFVLMTEIDPIGLPICGCIFQSKISALSECKGDTMVPQLGHPTYSYTLTNNHGTVYPHGLHQNDVLQLCILDVCQFDTFVTSMRRSVFAAVKSVIHRRIGIGPEEQRLEVSQRNCQLLAAKGWFTL